jgi:hypothetical protein
MVSFLQIEVRGSEVENGCFAWCLKWVCSTWCTVMQCFLEANNLGGYLLLLRTASHFNKKSKTGFAN